VQTVMHLQERTLNTSVWLVNVVDSVKVCTYQGSASGVGPAGKQLKVCADGKTAWLVHAVAYVSMRECTR